MPHDASIRIVKTRHDPRVKVKSDGKPWDYSIYPDLSQSQIEAFQTIGETLYMIQMAENAIKISIRFILNDENTYTIEDLTARNRGKKKRTLGQLLLEVRKYSDLHPQFDGMLEAFLEKRNCFIHQIFSSKEYGLNSDEQLARVNAFLCDLQDDAWNVQNVFLGCLRHWTKAHGIFDSLPQSIREDKHLTQLDGKGFELLLRQKK